MDKNRIKEISNSVKFDAMEKVADEIMKSAKVIEDKITQMQSIDTEGISPMTMVDPTPISFLREDVEGETLSLDVILKNAPTKRGNFITVPKGGNSDD